MSQIQTTNGVFVPSQATGEIPMTTNNIFLAPKSDAAEFERLPDGVYDAVCIGVCAREYADFNDASKSIPKIYFIFQITDQGTTYYFRSKPCKPIIGERSNLFVMVQSWSGATYERIAERFDATKMIGYGAQLVITTKIAKDGSGREFAEIANILKPKKGVKTPVVQDAIPAYLVRGNIALQLADGITVKEEIAPKPVKQTPVQKTAAPKMPANVQVSQAQDPAGWMGAQDFTVTQAAPVPSDMPNQAVQTAAQAMQQEGIAPEDDDDSLPF